MGVSGQLLAPPENNPGTHYTGGPQRWPERPGEEIFCISRLYRDSKLAAGGMQPSHYTDYAIYFI